jgi:hypothetical protein
MSSLSLLTACETLLGGLNLIRSVKSKGSHFVECEPRPNKRCRHGGAKSGKEVESYCASVIAAPAMVNVITHLRGSVLELGRVSSTSSQIPLPRIRGIGISPCKPLYA